MLYDCTTPSSTPSTCDISVGSPPKEQDFLSHAYDVCKIPFAFFKRLVYQSVIIYDVRSRTCEKDIVNIIFIFMTFVIRPFKIDVRIDLFYCEYMTLIQNLSFEILNQFRFTVLTNRLFIYRRSMCRDCCDRKRFGGIR